MIRSTTIFTDGSSRGNPGPGGWGSVVVKDNEVTELGGGEKNTTNNRMELTAAVEGLKRAEKGTDGEITVYTDSSYVINGITKWIHGWKRNGWKTKTKEDVLNKDLWMKLSEELAERTVQWKYVGGHVGILGNERCDHIATAFADGREVKLYDGPIGGYDLPGILNISLDEARAASKKSDSSHARAKAFSYISSVNGVIEVHHSWAECEKRVKGVRGARFKKALDAAEEKAIVREFGGRE
jgi:ribonuclease HI